MTEALDNSTVEDNPGPDQADTGQPHGKNSTQRYRAQWYQRSSLLLALAGLAISLYLSIAHFSAELLVCGHGSVVDCGSVTTSEQSELFGIPVAFLGTAFFIEMTVLSLPQLWRISTLDWIRLTSVSIGILFVVYLIAAEFILIGKICLWCTAVHVVTFALAGVVFASALRRA